LPVRIALLGSTGSIGQNTLEIVAGYPDQFRVVLLGCRLDADRLMEQAEKFRPQWVSIAEGSLSERQRDALKQCGIRLVEGYDGMRGMLQDLEYDIAVNAIIGAAGLIPTLDVLERGIPVALANKESLVMAGPHVMESAKRHNTTVLPIDSEHSAIHQCIRGEDVGAISRIILTASGGPFREDNGVELSSVTVPEVLKHPTWDMGAKITVDSATLINKALEVIEAHYLFDVPPDAIDVVIHPQSIIHSMVEFADGSIKAQLGTPDMKLPILYALTGGKRMSADYITTDLSQIGRLDFEKPDHHRFPCLNLAYRVLKEGGTAPAVLSSADEQAVELFLEEKIPFTGIYELVSAVLDEHEVIPKPNIDDILRADGWARERTRRMAGSLRHAEPDR
jgi:1-deoxy-D-xylulose-5-phosphate reductoisomerase